MQQVNISFSILIEHDFGNYTFSPFRREIGAAQNEQQVKKKERKKTMIPESNVDFQQI